jgi:predicted anti-sigma-YlaC factor YlaD
MYESLLSQNPNHQGLILTTGSLFVMYANAYVQGPADMLPPEMYYQRQDALVRAKSFYIRGADIILSGLEKKYPGFSAAQDEAQEGQLKMMKKEDVPSLYWAGAGILAAYSTDVFDFDLGSRIPEVTAMMARAYELDPDFGSGTLDEFYILFYASLPELIGGDKERAKLHFERALEKTGGLSAGAYVSYAQAVCVSTQDYEAFRENLEKALAVDVNVNPSTRLANTLSQRKARYMLDTAYNYFSFLPYGGEED